MVAFFPRCGRIHDGWRGEGRGRTVFVLIPSLIPIVEATGSIGCSFHHCTRHWFTDWRNPIVSENTDMSGPGASKVCGFYLRGPEIRARTGNRARLYNWSPELPSPTPRESLPSDMSPLSNIGAHEQHFTSKLRHHFSPKLQRLWVQVETRSNMLADCFWSTIHGNFQRLIFQHCSSGSGKDASYRLTLMIIMRWVTAPGSGVHSLREIVHLFPLRMLNLVPWTVCA